MKTFALVAAAAAAIVAAAPASAEDLALSAQVDLKCSLALAGQNASTLNLKNGEQGLGSFNITCNDPDGFKLNVSSQNGGKLKTTVAGGFEVTYQVTAGGGDAAVNFGYITPTVAGFEKTVTGFSPNHAAPLGINYSMRIRPNGTDAVLPGGVALTDTVVFTVTGL